MIKAIIFDLDGVLAKTDSFHYLSWKKMCDAHQFKFDKDLNNQLRGISRKDSLKVILDYNKVSVNDAEFDNLCNEGNNNYISAIEHINEESLFSDTLETLSKLKDMGIKLAIGSGSKNARKIIEQTGLNKYIDFVVDGNDVLKTKPDPEVFVRAAIGLGISERENVLVVEDAESGLIAANNGGFQSVAFGSIRSKKISKFEIDSLSDLIKIIKDLNS